MKFNLYFLIGVALIVFLVGLSVASIGQLPTKCNEPYSGALPFTLFMITATPFILGWFAGKYQED